jgi:hypothetical protein
MIDSAIDVGEIDPVLEHQRWRLLALQDASAENQPCYELVHDLELSITQSRSPEHGFGEDACCSRACHLGEFSRYARGFHRLLFFATM